MAVYLHFSVYETARFKDCKSFTLKTFSSTGSLGLYKGECSAAFQRVSTV